MSSFVVNGPHSSSGRLELKHSFVWRSCYFSCRYTETSDGTRHEYRKGDVMFQDNTKTSPADKQPEHYSGTVGDTPCHQLVVQLSRPPQVDNPCPF
jgi:hypothetical protein